MRLRPHETLGDSCYPTKGNRFQLVGRRTSLRAHSQQIQCPQESREEVPHHLRRALEWPVIRD
jgi:hypothetical protein